jgi:hypothetical protein
MHEYSTLSTPAQCPGEDSRAFLAQFPAARRSTVSNLFHYAFRTGAATPLAVIASVKQEILRDRCSVLR